MKFDDQPTCTFCDRPRARLRACYVCESQMCRACTREILVDDLLVDGCPSCAASMDEEA